MTAKIFKCLTVSFLLLSAVASLQAEEKKLEVFSSIQPTIESLGIAPNPVGLGDLFTMTIVVNHNNSAEVDFPLKEQPDWLQLWRGPYIRSFIENSKEGESVRKVRITTTFKARKSGRLIIPSLSVIADSRRLVTSPVLLKVGLYKNRQLYMPLEVEWQAGFDDIYAGEAIPLYLTVKRQEIVTLFDKIRVAYPRDGFFEEAGGLGDITSATEGDIVLYDVPAAVYIYTSPVAGRVKIPAAGVDFEGITGWAEDLLFDVKKLPSELKSGAVGKFKFSCSIDRAAVDAGGEILLTCTVEGDGNLNYLKMPVPETEGCLLVSSDEINGYSQSKAGFSGVKTIQWVYRADNTGGVSIGVPEFDYFDKETGTIITEAGNRFTVEVNEVPAETNVSIKENFPFEKKEILAGKNDGWKNYYRKYYMYVWLLPGAVFFILNLLLKGKRPAAAALLTVIIIVLILSIGRFVLNISEFSDDSANSPTFFYNQAVEDYNNGEFTESLHNLRTAVYLDPVNVEYRDMLNWIENRNGFINPVDPSIRLHPDIFYFILICAFNVFFLAVFFKRIRQGGGLSVLVILSAFLILSSSFMMFFSDKSRSRMTGIVCSGGSELKKIPRASAEIWMDIQEGTAVRILDESENFLLIETGLGVKGWAEEANVNPDRPASGEY